ncbi:ABC transporter permease [Clostridium sp. UBA7503]|uniref:ABC transporter permease n=1 Tax=Clostridium sp. UBA7503 TaxID=1946377 RepID=UPI003216BC1F
MINNYKSISIRYIKQNKKRTILTLIGIILSLSLVATIGLFITSAEKSQIDDIKRADGVSFHIGFSSYTEDILTKVVNNPSVERYGIMENGDTVSYNDINITICKMDKGATELFKYSIKEGRMPENENEIAIDQWAKDHIKENLDLQEKLTIGEKQYTIVAFLKNDIYSQREKSSKAFTFSNNPTNGRLLVEISPKADFSSTFKKLTDLTTEDKLIKNHALIRMNQMKSNKALIAAACIAIVIVVSATIIVIYNSFQINVAERLKQFGLLRSIGATKKQIKKIVFREASILLIIAIPIGIIVSLGAIYGINYIFKLLLKGDNPISLVGIDPMVLLISAIITTLAVYISSLIPANFVGKISPLAAISSRVVIKKDVIKKKKYPTLKKIFNYKVVMAVKNIRRNPGRCQTMILSIVVSSALFITFTSFMDEVFMVKGPSGSYQIIDLEVSKESDNNKEKSELDNNLLSQLKSLSNIDKVYVKYSNLFGFTEVPEDKRISETGDIYKRQKYGNIYKDGIDIELKTYDEVALKEINNHLISGEVNTENIKSENGVILVDNGKARDKNTNKSYIGKITDFRVGDKIVIMKDNVK